MVYLNTTPQKFTRHCWFFCNIVGLQRNERKKTNQQAACSSSPPALLPLISPGAAVAAEAHSHCRGVFSPFSSSFFPFFRFCAFFLLKMEHESLGLRRVEGQQTREHCQRSTRVTPCPSQEGACNGLIYTPSGLCVSAPWYFTRL